MTDARKAQAICGALLDDHRELVPIDVQAALDDPESRHEMDQVFDVHVLLQAESPALAGQPRGADGRLDMQVMAKQIMQAVRQRRRARLRMRRVWSLAAAACIVIGVLFAWRTSAARDDLATASSLQPWKHNGVTVAAGQSQSVAHADKLESGGAMLSLRGVDGTRLSLSAASHLDAPAAADQPWRLHEGHLHAEVARQSPDHPLRFGVREGTVVITGTILDVITDSLGSLVSVSEGSVRVLADGSETSVTDGRSLTLGSARTRVSPPQGYGVDLPWLGHATPMPVFNDRLLQSSGWVSLRTQQPAPADARGWPAAPLPEGGVGVALLTHMGAGYLPGSWTITWAGTGELSVNSWPKQPVELQRTSNRIRYDMPISDGIQVEVRTSDPADPIRDIRFLADESQAADALLATFRDDWNGVALVRGGMWPPPAVPGSPLTWDERLRPGDGPGSLVERRAVASETFAAAAEQLAAARWWIVPVQADDQYIDGLAQLAVRSAQMGQTTLVSYSNADLPSADEERDWLELAGVAAGHEPSVAAPRYAAERSLTVFARWRTVFAAAGMPLACLIPGGDRAWNQHITGWKRCGFHADAMTIADVVYVDCQPQSGETVEQLTNRLRELTLSAIDVATPLESDLDLPPLVRLDAGVVVRAFPPMAEVTIQAIRAWWSDASIQEAVARRRHRFPATTQVLVDWAQQVFQRTCVGVCEPGHPVRRADLRWLKPAP